MQQRTIDKLRKKLTKERKRRSKIQGKLKLSQEQSLQLQEALNAANKENERLETAREAQVLHKTNFTLSEEDGGTGAKQFDNKQIT